MTDFNDIKKLIESGREIEFSYNGKRYSITYGTDDSGEDYISFCEYYQPDTEYHTAESFMENASIDGTLLSTLWKDITDLEIF